jgi:Tol biopolymer transport system component
VKNGENYQQMSERGAKQLWTMWSADGKQMYYVSDRNGTQNIWTQTGKAPAKMLTNFTDGRVLWAKISYDGQQIVFERNFKIWTMNTDGGRAAEIPITLRGLPSTSLTERINLSTQIREFSLSPDGKKVAVVARGEIFAASSKDGGEAQRLTNTAAAETFAAWSPDSRKVVYTSERNGKLQIFQYDFATESETQITNAGDDFAPFYSPDGKLIAFIRNARSLGFTMLIQKRNANFAKFIQARRRLAAEITPGRPTVIGSLF